jgi:hypothetical protein
VRGKDAAAPEEPVGSAVDRGIAMIAARRTVYAASLACAAMTIVLPAYADTTAYEDVDGIRYQVTRRTMQVPITQTTPQQQTVYRQQVTTQTIQQQQQYTVPVTQYQLVSRLHGRWNPFVTPYWTHHYEPVTTWQQQTATVQIPVNTVAWAPQTQTVQMPTTTYRSVDAIVSRIPIGATPGAMGGSQQMMASSGATTASPSATLVARAPGSAPPAANATPLSSVPSVASVPTTYGAAGVGGTQLNSDPPRQGTAWQTPSPGSYR